MRGRRSTARRYAMALFEAAFERGMDEELVMLLRKASDRLEGSELKAILSHPSIPFEEKDGVISKVCDGNRLLSNLLGLLIKRGRLEMFPLIAEEYEGIWMRSRGIERAEVLVPRPLSDEDLWMIRRKLEERLGKKLSLELKVDPSLIGGMVVRVGGMLIDGSLRGRLERLRAVISGEERVRR
jgi:F-type H+-transporting ATPase subunit delta